MTKNPFRKPIPLIGHRGMGCTDSAFARSLRAFAGRPAENTLESFRRAIRQGANGLEADIIRTRDDQLVSMHSAALDEHVHVASARPVGKQFLDEITLAEAERLPLGADGSGRVATITALLGEIEALSDPSFLLNLEIKDVQGTSCPRRRPSIEKLALDTVKASGFPLSSIRFSSFSLDSLVALSEEATGLRVAMLFDLPVGDGGDVGKRMFVDGDEVYRGFTLADLEEAGRRIPNLEAVHPEIRTLTDETVRQVADRGLDLTTWAWRELPPQKSQAFGTAARNAVELCRRYDVSLAMITDHIVEMRSFLSALS